MKTKAAHLVRQASPDGRKAAVARKRRRQQLPPANYAPGHFLEPIRAHNWPPMFEGRITSDRIVSTQRTGTGYDAHPLNLPGAKAYTGQAPRMV